MGLQSHVAEVLAPLGIEIGIDAYWRESNQLVVGTNDPARIDEIMHELSFEFNARPCARTVDLTGFVIRFTELPVYVNPKNVTVSNDEFMVTGIKD